MIVPMFVLAVASLLACEASILVPGLESFSPCLLSDAACIKENSDKLHQALSLPYPKYSIKGYDPIVLPHLDVDYSRDYQINLQFTDLKVTGFGKTKTLSINKEGDDVHVTYQHNIKFESDLKAIFHVTPEVVKEGPVSGEFADVTTTYAYSVKTVERNGQTFLELGKEKILKVEVPSVPQLNKEQFTYFASHPDTTALMKKVTENALEFYKVLAVAIVHDVSPSFFNDKRKFYDNVPTSELYKTD